MHRFSRMHLSPEAALRSLSAIDLEEKSKVAESVALIAVIDHRRDYLAAGHPSMCDYCVRRLHMSEDKALKRIQVARVALQFPEVFECLADGRLSVTTANVVAPHLHSENAADLLRAAAFHTKQEILRLLADLARGTEPAPLLDDTATVQAQSKSHAPAHVESACESPNLLSDHASARLPLVAPEPARRGRIVPRGDGGHEVRLVLTDEEYEQLRQAQALLGHAVPSGDLALIYARAMQHFLTHLGKRRHGAGRETPANGSAARRSGASAPSSGSAHTRSIPMASKSLVWKRDGGRCAFVSEDGHRCSATKRLEFDHIVAVAKGGNSTPENLRLLCRAHNQYEAEREFGREYVQAKREQAQRVRSPGRAARRAEESRRAKCEQTHEVNRSAEEQARYDDLHRALRGLGFRESEAQSGAALADDMPGASLEACLRVALRELTRSVQVRGERLARCSA